MRTVTIVQAKGDRSLDQDGGSGEREPKFGYSWWKVKCRGPVKCDDLKLFLDFCLGQLTGYYKWGQQALCWGGGGVETMISIWMCYLWNVLKTSKWRSSWQVDIRIAEAQKISLPRPFFRKVLHYTLHQNSGVNWERGKCGIQETRIQHQRETKISQADGTGGPKIPAGLARSQSRSGYVSRFWEEFLQEGWNDRTPNMFEYLERNFI